MPDALERYKEMLLKPVVPTPVFHQVLGAMLDAEVGDEPIAHMRDLLQMPYIGHPEWEMNAMRLVRKNLISTVTEGEAMGAYLENEDPQTWDVLAQRVVEKRKAGN